MWASGGKLNGIPLDHVVALFQPQEVEQKLWAAPKRTHYVEHARADCACLLRDKRRGMLIRERVHHHMRGLQWTHHHRPLLFTAPVPDSEDTSRMQAAFTPSSSARLLIVSSGAKCHISTYYYYYYYYSAFFVTCFCLNKVVNIFDTNMTFYWLFFFFFLKSKITKMINQP